jgi:hypothetical protein
MIESFYLSILAYAATTALGYFIGWWRTSSLAKYLGDALADGKISAQELKDGMKLFKSLLPKR